MAVEKPCLVCSRPTVRVCKLCRNHIHEDCEKPVDQRRRSHLVLVGSELDAVLDEITAEIRPAPRLR